MIFPSVLRRPFLFLCFLLPAVGLAAKTRASRPAAEEGSFKGAIAIDAASGNVLYESNADIVSPPASMTKLMTFLIVSDKLQSGAITLQTQVQITAEDSRIGGTQVYLDPKESFTVEELIYAMMIQSANDAAHALARTAGGSIPAFVELMNAKARALGLTHTTFRSPHGLPPSNRRIEDGDLTSPRDFAKLCREALLKTDVLKYTSVKERDFGPNRPKGPQHMINHNKLLGKVAGVDGLKTGFTNGAGYCLSATAQRNGRRIIVVIMGAFGPGGAIDKGRSRDLKTIEIIERAFAALPPSTPEFKPLATAASGAVSPLSAAPLSAEEKAAASAEGGPVIKFNVPARK
ncbi:MAG: D-alanyl-D-alanine carboxypeptidase [Verrucomicrobia bacterium]|nr:D-alanyl-D-alanine carboxypeptidase [Verrucomicrobiota bacterium]